MNTNIISPSNLAAASGTNDIHGIKPPVAIPLSLFWVLVIIAVAILVAAAITVLIWWLLRKKAEPPPPLPSIPPHERARQSDTVRLYLEERFKFHAPDRTTEEFLYELQATNLLLPEQKQSLGEFLSVCDMVKFAKYEPGPPELQALHGSAVRLVDETEPQPLVPGSAPDASALSA
jgi:hypothetical protein